MRFRYELLHLKIRSINKLTFDAVCLQVLCCHLLVIAATDFGCVRASPLRDITTASSHDDTSHDDETHVTQEMTTTGAGATITSGYDLASHDIVNNNSSTPVFDPTVVTSTDTELGFDNSGDDENQLETAQPSSETVLETAQQSNNALSETAQLSSNAAPVTSTPDNAGVATDSIKCTCVTVEPTAQTTDSPDATSWDDTATLNDVTSEESMLDVTTQGAESWLDGANLVDTSLDALAADNYAQNDISWPEMTSDDATSISDVTTQVAPATKAAQKKPLTSLSARGMTSDLADSTRSQNSRTTRSKSTRPTGETRPNNEPGIFLYTFIILLQT